jgi:energy-coupling factor transporter ATP-binding protein EcfA2
MMAIRIDRIKVNRGGPLENDFQLETGDLNLIYGHNETGKSYIVEAIINLLFRTGKASKIDWNLRGWDFAGSIIVSGLDDKPTTFTKTGKKMNDYWGQETGLPQDFSHLLVVKEAETSLSYEAEDGVGRDILKNYLSGEGLLDKIEGGISVTLRKAEVQDKRIICNQTGEIKKKAELLYELNELDSLLKEAENAYTSGVTYALQQEQKPIVDEIESLEKAKRYHAHCLQTKIKSLNKKKESMPSEEQLSQIESDVSVYEDKKREYDRKSSTVASLESEVESYLWTEKALQIYREIIVRQVIVKPKVVYAVLAFILFAAVIVTGFLNLDILMAICAAGSFTLILFYLIRMQRALASAGSGKELARLKIEFKRRYGSELTDVALLEAKVEELRKGYSKSGFLKGELVEKLTPDLERKEDKIKEDLKKFVDAELPPQEWRSSIGELRGKLSGLGNEIKELEKESIILDIPEEDLLDQDPGIKWDTKRYKYLKGELERISGAIGEESRKLVTLGARIAQEIRSDSTDWEELISTLHDTREIAAEKHRGVTAEILAKVQLTTVIGQFREEENARIARGLESQEFTKPLHSITGCYKGIRHDEENGLVLITDEDEEYPLVDISTGAREQTLIAMRIGFSSTIMKGQTAFLILDDAFQFSDWTRRVNLMDQILRLVTSGWQIFYFTMDDNIRELFLKAGKKLGDRLKTVEL